MYQLLVQRGFYRTAFTKLISTLDDLVADARTPAHRLPELIDIILAKHAHLVTFHKDIQAVLHGEDIEADFTTASDYEDRVICAKERVQRVIEPQSPTPPAYPDVTTAPLSDPLAGRSQPTATLPSPGLPTPAMPSRLTLAKLHIANFSGDRRNRPVFCDQFQTSIPNNDWIQKIGKIQYLITFLTEAVKAAIKGIRFAEANYDVAIQILSDRFNYRDILVDNHVNSLLSIAPVRSSAHITLLRNLHDEATFCINALEGL
ncbi:uncharacterized protein LOC142767901 [Rhipicephalus microplus]|uniref:uncharacterized protein LOC142767901 n=1 Tax=Rhipicephalus microplus TaxID=6941 RepID=UPI003F6A5C82